MTWLAEKLKALFAWLAGVLWDMVAAAWGVFYDNIVEPFLGWLTDVWGFILTWIGDVFQNVLVWSITGIMSMFGAEWNTDQVWQGFTDLKVYVDGADWLLGMYAVLEVWVGGYLAIWAIRTIRWVKSFIPTVGD